jgi:hypothetical protein
LRRLLGEKRVHKGVEDSLQRLKRAAEGKVQHAETRSQVKGMA